MDKHTDEQAIVDVDGRQVVVEVQGGGRPRIGGRVGERPFFVLVDGTPMRRRIHISTFATAQAALAAGKRKASTMKQHAGRLPHGVSCGGCYKLRRCNECGAEFSRDRFTRNRERCTSGRCYPRCCAKVCRHAVAPQVAP